MHAHSNHLAPTREACHVIFCKETERKGSRADRTATTVSTNAHAILSASSCPSESRTVSRIMQPRATPEIEAQGMKWNAATAYPPNPAAWNVKDENLCQYAQESGVEESSEEPLTFRYSQEWSSFVGRAVER